MSHLITPPPPDVFASLLTPRALGSPEERFEKFDKYRILNNLCIATRENCGPVRKFIFLYNYVVLSRDTGLLETDTGLLTARRGTDSGVFVGRGRAREKS